MAGSKKRSRPSEARCQRIQELACSLFHDSSAFEHEICEASRAAAERPAAVDEDVWMMASLKEELQPNDVAQQGFANLPGHPPGQTGLDQPAHPQSLDADDTQWPGFGAVSEHATTMAPPTFTAEMLRDAEQAILDTGVVQAMMQDHCIMKANLREHDLGLRAALQEVRRLRMEVSHMERLRSRAVEIKDILMYEKDTQVQLQLENCKLVSARNELLSLLHSALDADGDVELEGLADALVAENGMLWRLVRVSEAASEISMSTPQIPPLPRRQRPSFGSRSARSSAASSPTRTSPGARGGGRLGSPSQADIPQDAMRFSLEGVHMEESDVGGPVGGEAGAAGAAGRLPGHGMLFVDEAEELEASSMVECAIFLHAPTADSDDVAAEREVDAGIVEPDGTRMGLAGIASMEESWVSGHR